MIKFTEVKKAPFEIREHGYGSFNSQIEVFFKNLGDPDKITYQYDLFLRRDIQPVKHLRCETLTFKHPNSEFKQLLLLANGVSIHIYYFIIIVVHGSNCVFNIYNII